MFRIRRPIEDVWKITVKHNGLAKWYKGGKHKGIDLRTRTEKNPHGVGTPVRAAASGRWQSVEERKSMGLTVVLEHDNGYETVYGHLCLDAYEPGYDAVKAGDIIGYSGKSGRLCFGPHLHFETLKNGVSVDPEKYIKAGDELIEWAKARSLMRVEKDGSINFLIKGGVVKLTKENCWDIVSNNTWGISEKDYKDLLDLL